MRVVPMWNKVTCKEPHKVENRILRYAAPFFVQAKLWVPRSRGCLHGKSKKGGDDMGQKDDVLTDDLVKTVICNFR